MLIIYCTTLSVQQVRLVCRARCGAYMLSFSSAHVQLQLLLLPMVILLPSDIAVYDEALGYPKNELHHDVLPREKVRRAPSGSLSVVLCALEF
jgi:hypothetical protein